MEEKTQGELQKGFSKKRSEVNPSYKKEMTVSKFGVDRPVHSRPNPRRFGFKKLCGHIMCSIFVLRLKYCKIIFQYFCLGLRKCFFIIRRCRRGPILKVVTVG